MRRLEDYLRIHAQRCPEAPAVVFRGESLTYGELEACSDRVVGALRDVGCVSGDRVAMLLPKSPRAIAAMFGTLKADCTYVPIDTTSPSARIDRILQKCDCRCLLAEDSVSPLVKQLGALCGEVPPILMMDGPLGEYLSESKGSRSTSSAPAHILFTSGSTGVPKGVVISHASVISFIDWAVRYFGITADDRISGHPPLHFDLSGFDIYGTIAAGAQLHLVPPEANLIPHRLADFMREARLTQWFSAPSALLPCARLDVLKQGDLRSLRRLLWCGEKFPTPDLMYWMQHLPHVAFYNLYGPTETTIASSCYRVPRCPEDPSAEIPIGSPCEGERLLLLDGRLRPVAPGETGNLYIGGAGLSDGYWRDSEQTANVFLPDPSSAGAERIYKTGDLARIGGDGEIYLLGRADSQVKVRGHRIELGEIESAIHTLQGVRDCAAVALESPEEGVSICCAYVSAPGCSLSSALLKRELGRTLPRYMIPSRWMELESMPHNGNGKRDRVRLKEWFRTEAEERGVAAGGLSGVCSAETVSTD